MQKQKIQKSITINAPKEKVWKALTEQPGLNLWMQSFSPDVVVKGEWKLGEVLVFGDVDGNGMTEKVVENRPNEYAKLHAISEKENGNEKIYDGVENADDFETYEVKEENGVTTLSISSFFPVEAADMDFDKLWENALNKVKELAEV